MPQPKPLNRATVTRIFLSLMFFAFHFYSNSQTLNWAFKAGGASRDESYNIHIDGAGNVLKTGFLSGTVDFDPSAAVFNLTSAGSEDIFVAKYTSTGTFLWAFRIGGGSRDWGLAITSDASDNVIVTGFFRGSNIDFDPSAATANLTSNGDAGADPGYGGDIFVAKYSSAGNYQWAFNIGGSELYDAGVAVVSDAASNIYVGGYFKGPVDFDPSAATSTLTSSTGTIFLSKYSPAGNYQWAFNTGLGDNNNSIFDLKADNAGNVYVAGYFQGTNIDFDPSPAVNALSSNGAYEIFFAKYTTNGQYVFAKSIGGSGNDVARGLDIDNNGNIYLIGDFNGTNIDFDPGSGTAPLNSNGSEDVFLAKFTNAGNYIWAFNFGSGASDIGWKVSTDNIHLFITGGFTGTSDMNPSAVVDNLVSNGGNDIFLGKYNLNGEYLCAFNIGGPFDDYGSAITTAGTNTFYLTGYFQGNNVDFDPTTATFPLSSAGGSDIFLSKFIWPDNTPAAGTLSGVTICTGQQAQLTFNSTAGTGPFTIVYNNGTTNVTVNNVQSGVPFNITPNPTATTTYTLVSIRDAQRCSETSLVTGVTATVTVNACNGAQCDSWLNTPSQPSYVNIGDLDISGNQLTIEATFFTTLNNGFGDLVAKHSTTTDVNYLLRAYSGEITTTNGYFKALSLCPISHNKIYHVAMVYNGTSLKFYRNGFLLAQVPATGNLVQNNWQTWIGFFQPQTLNENFIGFVNEVRIWNVARTQTEIQTYMHASLPNPPTQPGLLAYYIFNNLFNKQGNPLWNGTLGGAATINQTIPDCSFVADSCNINPVVVTASFTTPDTVCVNTPVNITNTSSNATTYYWNFCTANINAPPTGTNLGNISGLLDRPVYIDYVLEAGNYYGFVVNNAPRKLLRLNFGNSLLNTPTATDLGTVGGTIPENAEGVQIVKNQGNWYVIIVGGETPFSNPSIVKIELGASITNNSPVGTNWGNLGNLAYPHDLYVFNENGNWYGFTVNTANSTITRFDFTNSFSNVPIATNLGNIGNLNSPTGLHPIKDNNNWYLFVTNATSNTITRLDFGTSLLSTPTGLSLGNIGNLNFPHCISKIFRVGADLYSFVTNVNNNTLTRLQFTGCNNASIPNSTLQNPPPVTYNTAGIYNINLTVDDGLPTQTAFCKQVVVKNCFIPLVINDYTPVLSLDVCKNILNVGDATKYKVGDTVLMMQMKGAVIDSTNTSSFGTVTNYNNAGNYEYNYVKSKNGNSIELLNKIIRQYDLPNGKVQLIRVPYYQNYTVPDSNTLTSLPWNGSVGGVLAFNVQNNLTLNSDIDVSGKGFRGGIAVRNALYNCNIDSFYLANNNGVNGNSKGEGIYNTLRLTGRGKLANGGGGGNSVNSGGGGGGNGGIGGDGGKQYVGGCNYNLTTIAGIGGSSLNYSNAQSKIFLGGGGGVGHEDDTKLGDGGYGGGIVIISANSISPNGFSIQANGLTPQHLTGTNDDGRNGGGGGGTVLLNYTNTTGNLPISVKGGKGEDCIATPAMNLHGPGGGGGGGVVWVNQASVPASLIIDATGGVSGVNINQGNNPWGATAGANGISLTNLVLPITTALFKPNIDSVRIKDSAIGCASFDFKGLAYTNTNPISTWQWYFGDGGTASTQNTSHNYSSAGTFTVKLVVTDVNGCKDSIITNVTTVVCTETIINDYTPVLSLDPCKNIINVGDASAFNIGDTVLIIQMKGAVIDSSNTISFGLVSNYKNAGNYEYNYVKSKNGNSIELLNKLERQYDLPGGKVQLIRVPYFQNYSVPSNTTLSCLPWNGNIGGVLVFNTQNTLTLNGNIDVSGKGFLGGRVINTNLNAANCFTNNYFYPNGSIVAAPKGESIANISSNISSGKGNAASAGGGGNDHNSGGGGGGNATSGGLGGYQLYECNNTFFDNRGVGGRGLTYNNASNKIFMGGGGGAGHCNNGFLAPTENTNYNGGNGGGIVLITANTITGNNFSIISRGDSAFERNSNGLETHDGMGGGGAGGTILISINNYSNNLNIDVKGGKGGDMHASMVGGHIGPGGGGAGGVVWFQQGTIPGNVTINNPGGRGGYLLQDNNNPYGTTPGSSGLNVFGLQIPIDNVLFKPNIDSVRIKDSLKTCTDFDFKGFAYTNSNPIASWQWYFGDGGTANTQNTSHSYAPGNYTVKLIITDMNGCKDSVIKNIVATTLTVNAGNDTTICSGQSITLLGSTNGGIQFQWNNTALLNNNTVLTPIATPPTGVTTTFIITATNAAGCSRSDSVDVIVKAPGIFSINAPSPICPNGTAQLLAQGGDVYLWQSLSGNNATIPNPVVSPATTTTYTVQIRDTVCNQTQNLSTQVVVLSLPNVQAFKQNDIDCIQNTARLNASGAVSYKWTPAINLSNPNISNPIATPTTTTLYTVEGTDASGCKNTDTISVKVDFSNKNGMFLVPNAFTPNNDGLNDCFGVKHWGAVESLEFNIYNRWGELIFHTTDITQCWDGKWKGRDQDPAVFVYWIKAKSICGGDVFRKGTVVLIR